MMKQVYFSCMQTSEHQKPVFFSTANKTKQNLNTGSATYHDSEQFVVTRNGRAGQIGSVFICKLIEHNLSQATEQRLASN